MGLVYVSELQDVDTYQCLLISCRAPSLNMPKLWQWSGQRTPKVGRAEFLSRPKNVSPFGNQWNAPRDSFAWSDSPVKGTLLIKSQLLRSWQLVTLNNLFQRYVADDIDLGPQDT